MKIAAAFAGLGAAVGAVLFVVVRFVAGQSVRDGLGYGAYGLPRRYVDYLRTDESSLSSDLRVLGVLLVAGFAAGALVGVALWVLAARRPVVAGRRPFAAALAVFGLVLGAGLAVGLHLYTGRITGGADFGWYSYSGGDGVLYGGGPAPSWWPLVLTGAAAGLLLGAVAAGAVCWRRQPRVQHA